MATTEQQQQECTICLEPIVFRGGAPIFSPGCCGGSFHLACVVTLIRSSRNPCCPNCRAGLPAGLNNVTTPTTTTAAAFTTRANNGPPLQRAPVAQAAGFRTTAAATTPWYDHQPNPYRPEDGIHRPAPRIPSPRRFLGGGALGVQGNLGAPSIQSCPSSLPVLIGVGSAWTIVAFRGEHSVHPSQCSQCAGTVKLTDTAVRCPCGEYNHTFFSTTDEIQLTNSMQQASIN